MKKEKREREKEREGDRGRRKRRQEDEKWNRRGGWGVKDIGLENKCSRGLQEGE